MEPSVAGVVAIITVATSLIVTFVAIYSMVSTRVSVLDAKLAERLSALEAESIMRDTRLTRIEMSIDLLSSKLDRFLERVPRRGEA